MPKSSGGLFKEIAYNKTFKFVAVPAICPTLTFNLLATES